MRPRQVAPLGALVMLATMTAAIHAMPRQDSNAAAVTFDKQLLPILQKNCQACHRPGEIAPMSFLTTKRCGRGRRRSKPRSEASDAAVVRRSGRRSFRERQAAERRGHRDADPIREAPASWDCVEYGSCRVNDPQRDTIRRNSSKKLNTKVT